MRRLPILNITPSTTPGVPSSIQIGLDFTSIFHGQEWIDGNGARSPFYTYTNATAPYGTVVLVATTFDVVGNSKFDGRYTVYTKTGDSDLDPATYDGVAGTTTIRVNESLPTGAGAELTTGYVTHISTYLLTIAGESSAVVLESQDKSDRPVELVGRFSTGWGETMMQNMLNVAQCFAGSSAPTKPFQGMLWFDTINNVLKVKPTSINTNDWVVANAAYLGGAPFRFTLPAPATTWTITHNLGLPAPYIAAVDFFVNTVNGVKPILPSDVTFVDANTLTASFSTAESGYAVVRG